MNGLAPDGGLYVPEEVRREASRGRAADKRLQQSCNFPPHTLMETLRLAPSQVPKIDFAKLNEWRRLSFPDLAVEVRNTVGVLCRNPLS